MRLTVESQAFWKWLARFVDRHWCHAGDQRPVGIPGNRDPESPCTAYAPRPKRPGDFEDCQGDGHYLCRECCHLDRETDWLDPKVLYRLHDQTVELSFVSP